MESASQTLRMWHGTFSRLWKRHADPSDFVWLGRFRLLSLYTILKGLLIVSAGGIGSSISSLQSRSLLSQTPLLWIGIILGLTIAMLLMIAGLVLASKGGPRSIGLVTLGASDIFVLLAVEYAFILNNLFLLLIILVFISSTTPLLIERISRYAKRYLQGENELARLNNERDLQLRRSSQELTRAIEQQRLSLNREIHDGLMQELCALSLQISVMIRRNSEDGALRLDAKDVVRLETALRRAVTETKSVMAGLENTTRALDTIDTIEFPKIIA